MTWLSADPIQSIPDAADLPWRPLLARPVGGSVVRLSRASAGP